MSADLPSANGGGDDASADDRGAPTLLQALRAFKDAQSRRVAHWAEYDAAMTSFSQQPRDGRNKNPVNGSMNDAGSAGHSHSHANGNGLAPAAAEEEEDGDRSAAPAAHPPSSHYDPAPRSIDDGVMSQILRLVTSGLLECSHEVRAIQIELGSADGGGGGGGGGVPASADGEAAPSQAAAQGQPAPAPAPAAHFNRPDLAALVGDIQDLENALLRKTVERDQAKRIVALTSEGGGDAGSSSSSSSGGQADTIAAAQREITRIKAEIMEKMQEVNAEMAELL